MWPTGFNIKKLPIESIYVAYIMIMAGRKEYFPNRDMNRSILVMKKQFSAM
jgi:hypothetical protein